MQAKNCANIQITGIIEKNYKKGLIFSAKCNIICPRQKMRGRGSIL
jgi:hypothetical protein